MLHYVMSCLFQHSDLSCPASPFPGFPITGRQDISFQEGKCWGRWDKGEFQIENSYPVTPGNMTWTSATCTSTWISVFPESFSRSFSLFSVDFERQMMFQSDAYLSWLQAAQANHGSVPPWYKNLHCSFFFSIMDGLIKAILSFWRAEDLATCEV